MFAMIIMNNTYNTPVSNVIRAASTHAGGKKPLDRAIQFVKFDALLLALLGPHFLFRQKTANFQRVLIAKGDNTQLDTVAKPAIHCPRHEDVDS